VRRPRRVAGTSPVPYSHACPVTMPRCTDLVKFPAF
jgi:hypothetical protein